MKLITLILLIFAVTASAQVKQTPRKKKPRPYSTSLQAIVVTTPDWNAIQGTARIFKRRTTRSRWIQVGEAFPIVVGRTGLAWGTGLHKDPAPKSKTQNPKSESDLITKKEGDGKSPAGIFSLSGAFGRLDKPKGTKLSYLRLMESTECVDDVKSFHYNSTVDRFQVGIFDWKSSEKMAQVDPEYDLGVFVDHNIARVRGDGSCIFLHIWKTPDTPTAGCTAMSRENAERVLEFLDPKRNPVLIQMPEEEYSRLQRSWRLPLFKREM